MRLLTILSLALCVAFQFCGCGPRSDTAEKPKGGGSSVGQEFIYNSGAEPESLDPHTVTTVDGSRLIESLFEGLVTPDPKTLEPLPGCAKSWEVLDDGRTYTFTLRDGLKWSDDQALTAQQFADSFKRVLTAETAAPYAELYYYIKGAKAMHQGDGNFDSVGVKVDGNTITFELAVPCPFFLELLTLPVFSPVRLDVIERHGKAWTEGGNLVGNGPFRLESWEHRDKLILKKNEKYWDKNKVKLAKVTALCIEDQNTAYKMFKEGEIQWMTSVPQGRIDEIKHEPDFYSYPYFGTYFYRFNVTEKPFDNPKVRRAFALAIRRDEITQMLKGGQRPVGSYCPAVGRYTPAEGIGYNLEEARKLLAEAGYPDGKGLPTIEIKYNTNEGHKQVAETIAQQWKQGLGVDVVSSNQEWKVFLNDMKELKYMIARSSWIGDYSDPSTFYECFESTSGNNRTGWKSKAYDQLLAESRTTSDQKKRIECFTQMEKMLVEEECPIVPIYRYVDQGMLVEKVRGWHPNIRSVHPLKYVWLE